MTSSEFTEHFSVSNKVHYLISDKNNFTVVIKSVVGRENYIDVKFSHFTIYDVFLQKFILLLEANLQESVDRFKSTNYIFNIKVNILCEVPVMKRLLMVDDNLDPLCYGTSSRYKRHTFATVGYKKRKMAWKRG